MDLAGPLTVDDFTSPLSNDSKLERALVVAFALAEVLVQGGERVGVPGLTRPTASRNVIEKMAEAILHDPTERASLPPSFVPSPLSEIVVCQTCGPRSAKYGAQSPSSRPQARMAMRPIVDPAEESFPYSGQSNTFSPKVPAA